MFKLHAVRVAAIAAVLVSAMSARYGTAADPGVLSDRIVVGQSAALEGPAGALGQGMHLGLKAAFREVNGTGGVNGRRIELVSLDDGYEPDRAVANVRKLIEEERVFALIGSVGTPTAAASQPIATEAGVPFVAPFTGAGFLRDSKLTNVINVRASYDQETEAWIKHLTEDLKIARIAVLFQDDSFGRAGLAGVEKALSKRAMKPVATGSYARNTVAVKTALLDIRKGEPEAVVMVGAYKPIAEFIKLAKKINLNPVFVTISFVGSDALAAELGAEGAGVVVTQVVPFPEDTSLPVVKAFHAALKAVDPAAKPGFVSLEGYLSGLAFIEGLKRAGGEPSRGSFLAAMHRPQPIDLGGVILSYGSEDNQGSDGVFLTVIEAGGGRFRAIEHLTPPQS